MIVGHHRAVLGIWLLVFMKLFITINAITFSAGQYYHDNVI